jgi:hypothetical protein
MNIQRVTLAFGRRQWRSGRVLAAVLCISLLLSTIALASTAQSYTISWWTVDGGGGTSTNGGYSLSGTIGQPDAGPVLTNGGYTLAGGFWGGTVTSYRLYLPQVLRQS